MSCAVVIPHKGIGDLIWHLPYIRAIAAHSAGGQVVVIARPSSRAAELLTVEPAVSQVIEFDRRPRGDAALRGRHDNWREQLAFVRELRALRLARIYNFSGRFRYGLLAQLAGVPERAGFGFSWGERLFLNAGPCIERHSGLGNWVYPEATEFAIAHGFVAAPVVPRIHLPQPLIDTLAHRLATLPRPRYAFAIGSSDHRRNWGAARFAALANALAEHGAGVLLMGGPAEGALAAQIIELMQPRLRAAAQPLCQRSVLVSAAGLRNCDRCIGNDTGVLNMAAACGLPTWGLFGASPPLHHDPLLQAVTGTSMDAISVDSVLAALQRMPVAPAAIDLTPKTNPTTQPSAGASPNTCPSF
jgi:heptosyltransferase II